MAVIRWQAGKALRAKTGGHYPAPEEALDLVLRTLHRSIEASLDDESRRFAVLANGEVSRNLVQLFFMQESAKKKKVTEEAYPATERVAVIGAGVMGAGIAQWCSARGLRVVLKDIAPEAVASGLKTIRKVTQQAVKRRIMTPAEGQAVLDRIVPSHQDLPMRDVDVVIEAIVERMEVKQSLFANLSSSAGPQTLLASNTSALSVSTMAEASADPGKVCGIHFFNPVHRMALVEVVEGKQSSPEAMQRAVSLVQRIGKTPVVVQDRPGFVVNRVLMPYLIEAGILYEQGVQVQAVDDAMLQFGMPMGPMRLMDEIGIDVCLHVAEFLCRELAYLPTLPKVLARMVEEKKLGRKSGEGFYRYQGKKSTPKDRGDLQATDRTTQDLQDRMVLPMLNEAARILEEKVVASPEDVDLAMVLGTGFAPFTGGPLRYADAQGVSDVVGRMKKYASSAGEHFAPCVYIRKLATDEKLFYSKG